MRPNYEHIREMELELGFREPDEEDSKETYLQWHAAKDEASLPVTLGRIMRSYYLG
jgi:hypothetical protein